MPHKFNPAHMARLESDERLRRQPPAGLLAAIGVRAGARMADIGCGPGFYTLPAARLVGAAGRVFALDLQEPMLARVREKAAAESLGNVEVHLSEEDRLPLPDGTADVALVANVLHECTDRVAFLREVRRILVPGGRVAVIEWRREPMEMGPPLAERIGADVVEAALADACFTGAVAVDPTALGATHYGLLATVGTDPATA